MPCQSLPAPTSSTTSPTATLRTKALLARTRRSSWTVRSWSIRRRSSGDREPRPATAMRGRQDHVPRGVDDAWPGLLLRVSPPGGTRSARAWPRRPPLAAVDANGGSAHLAVLVFALIVANAHLSRLRRGGRVGGLAWADRPWAARRGDLQQGACQFSRSMVWPAVGARYRQIFERVVRVAYSSALKSEGVGAGHVM